MAGLAKALVAESVDAQETVEPVGGPSLGGKEAFQKSNYAVEL